MRGYYAYSPRPKVWEVRLWLAKREWHTVETYESAATARKRARHLNVMAGIDHRSLPLWHQIENPMEIYAETIDAAIAEGKEHMKRNTH